MEQHTIWKSQQERKKVRLYNSKEKTNIISCYLLKIHLSMVQNKFLLAKRQLPTLVFIQ